MDQHSNVLEVQRGVDEHSAIRTLVRISPSTPQADILAIWNRIKGLEYISDDPGHEVAGELFLRQVYDPMSECYEYPEKGYVVIANIVPPVNAVIHFMTYEGVDPMSIITAKHEILDRVFKELKLMRLTAMIPTPNKAAIRLATMCRFRFEGAMKKCWLKHGHYSDVQIFGLLRDEYLRREVAN